MDRRQNPRVTALLPVRVWGVDAFALPCINAGPGVSTRPDQVVISAQNRNFPGRSGPGQMYLASPLTVAASAVAGYITEYEAAAEREAVSA